jgi:hypothetical protein
MSWYRFYVKKDVGEKAASFFLILLQIQGFARQNALVMMKREAYYGEQTKHGAKTAAEAASEAALFTAPWLTFL